MPEGLSSESIGPSQSSGNSSGSMPSDIYGLRKATSIGADKGPPMQLGMMPLTPGSLGASAMKMGIGTEEIGSGPTGSIIRDLWSKSRSTNPTADLIQMGGNLPEASAASASPHTMMGRLLEEMSKRHGADYLKVLEKYKDVPLKVLHDAYTSSPVMKVAGDMAERSGVQNVAQNVLPNIGRILRDNALSMGANKVSSMLGIPSANESLRKIFGGDNNAR
jgi:hypothetical protein